MSEEIRAEITTAAKALCHYPSGPSNVNSCCQGIPRCEMGAAIAEIARLRAELATARREGMEKAAKRLEELHKNHNYDPESGTLTRKLGRYDRWPESAKTAKLEHDTGYYRAIAEGVAHILCAAAKEDREP